MMASPGTPLFCRSGANRKPAMTTSIAMRYMLPNDSPSVGFSTKSDWSTATQNSARMSSVAGKSGVESMPGSLR